MLPARGRTEHYLLLCHPVALATLSRQFGHQRHSAGNGVGVDAKDSDTLMRIIQRHDAENAQFADRRIRQV